MYATTKRNLQLHVKSVHDGVKYNCERCDYKATTKSSLCMYIVHVQSIHEGVKYNCKICDYKATQASDLIKTCAICP